MKVFITVGTTRFDSFVKYVDDNLLASDFKVTMQIADGFYKPLNFDFFEYSQQIDRFYNESDIVITHAGAGTIYHLLELGKKIIIVPNFERLDDHQRDISLYMKQNNYAYVLDRFSDLNYAINVVKNTKFKKFEELRFFKASEILDFINSDN